jgi:uncharacterized membrane protein YcaP (DUF421 family)
MIVAVFLGLLVLASHALFLRDIPYTSDIIRGVIFVLTAFVVARMAESLKKVEDLFKTLTT